MQSKNVKESSIFKFLISGIAIGIILSAIAVGAYHQSGNARFCGSCHSMNPVHHQWKASNHHQYTCTECHLPDTHIIGQVAYKTKAGINDLIHETARDYPVAIGLSDHARQIVNGNCVRCHASTVAPTPMAQGGGDCIKCHRYLVHGRGNDQGGIKIEK
ncbi:MAG TPA: NapC/NirT family cytochrome c [Smithellaceae bacterium]|nr:NapC/NirT family cytochrome c [Smithellaceae bacterium]HRY37090.1 NapC/NirT family cytochrome c [Smithellaceae bacterium]